jgi:hypothetical protein
MKEVWQENKVLDGLVDETFEMGVAVALVRFNLVHQGAQAEERGRFAIFPADRHDVEFIDVPSGEQIAVAAGTYDVRLRYREGGVTKERWLPRQVLAGAVDRSVEMSQAPALPESRPMPETIPQTLPAETRPVETRPVETQAASRGTALANAREGSQPATPETPPGPGTAPETRPAPVTPAPPMIPAPPPNLTPVPVEPFIWRRWFGCGLAPEASR